MIALLMLVIVLGAMGSTGGRGGSRGATQATRETVQALAADAARWATVSRQDQNPLVALMHANYGVAYANVAQRLSGSDEAFTEQTGRNAAAFYNETLELQAAAVQRTTALAPQLAPPSAGLTAVMTGWLAQ
jgi:hypothetical protein